MENQNISVDELTGEIKPEVKTQEQPFEAPKKESATPLAVQSANTQGTIQYKAWDGSDITLTVALAQKLCVGGGNLTQDEFLLFAARCKTRKLNPFTKECYPIKYAGANTDVAIIENWNNFLRVADESPEFDGMEDGIVVANEKGEIQDIVGNLVPKGFKLIGGWAKAYRKDRKFPFVARLDLDEFAKKHKYDKGDQKKGDLQGTWATMPNYMINKCAKSIALRLAFPAQLSGAYIAEEFGERVVEEGTATAII